MYNSKVVPSLPFTYKEEKPLSAGGMPAKIEESIKRRPAIRCRNYNPNAPQLIPPQLPKPEPKPTPKPKPESFLRLYKKHMKKKM